MYVFDVGLYVHSVACFRVVQKNFLNFISFLNTVFKEMLNVECLISKYIFAMPCESVVRATTQVNGEMGNSTLATPKPLNRSCDIRIVDLTRRYTLFSFCLLYPKKVDDKFC